MPSKTKVASFLGLFSYFDVFKVPINLYYKHHTFSYSKFGITLSIGLLAFLIWNFSQSELVLKRSPYVISQTITKPHANPIRFDNSTLLAFSVTDDRGTNFFDSSLFSIKIMRIHMKLNSNNEFEIISQSNEKIHQCSDSEAVFDPLLLKKISLKNAFCLENKEFVLEGFWDENELTYLSAELLFCANSTSNNESCKSREQIKSFFNSKTSYFNMYVQGLSVDVNNYMNPMSRKSENYQQMIDPAFIKRGNYFFRNTEIITTEGWVFSGQSIRADFSKEKYDFDFSLQTGSNNILQQFFLYSSHDIQSIDRRYQNLSDALAILAGLAHFLIFFGSLVTNLRNKLSILQTIIDSLYLSPSCQSENVKIFENFKNEKQEINLGKNIALQSKKEACCPEKKLKENFWEKLLNFFNYKKCYNNLIMKNYKKESQPKFSLRISLWEYISYYLSKPFFPSPRQKIIESAIKTLEKEMDIVKILRKLKEIEKLKLVIFNEDQRVLFQSLSKPMLPIKDKTGTSLKLYNLRKKSSTKMASMIMRYKLANRDKKKWLESYKNVNMAKDSCDLNARLLELVDLYDSFKTFGDSIK